MPLVCSACGGSRPQSEYSKHQRGAGVRRLCVACREPSRGRRLELAAAGLRECHVCREPKPLADLVMDRGRRSGRCKSCVARKSNEHRRSRGRRELRPRASIGSAEAGFTCRVCRVRKPAAEFHAGRYRDYRCRECQSARQRLRCREPRGQFTSSRNIAKRRGIAWGLAFEDYERLRALPCAYCGWPLAETGLGLDRKDCGGAYTADNVVPCCMECNLAKGSIFTHEEMKVLGAAVAEVKAQRQKDGGQQATHDRGWGRPRKYADAG